MSPPVARTIGSTAARRPANRPASGPSNGVGSWTSVAPDGRSGAASGAATTRIAAGERPHGIDGVIEQRATVDAARPACRARTGSTGRRRGRSPSRRSRRSPCGSRRRSRPRPSARAGGRPGSGAGCRAGRGRRGSPSRTCGSCRWRRAGPPASAVRVGPPRAPSPRSRDRSRWHRQGRARGRRSGPSRSSSRIPVGRAGGGAGGLDRAAVAQRPRAPVRDGPSPPPRAWSSVGSDRTGSGSAGRARRRVRGDRRRRADRAGRRRPRRRRFARSSPGGGARGPRRRAPRSARPPGRPRQGCRRDGSLDVRRDQDRTRPGAGARRDDAVEVEPGGFDRAQGHRAATAAASRATRSLVWRRREMPRAGSGSRTTAPTIRSAPELRRRTRRSPVATAIGTEQRRIAALVPVGQLEGVATAPSHGRIGGGRPEVDPCPRAIGQRRRQPHEDAIAGDDRRVVGQDQTAMEVAGLDAGEVERRPAGSGRLDRGAVDLDLADSHGPVARHEPEGRAAGQRPAAQRTGHHDAATLDREDPIDREARPGGRRPRPRAAAPARVARSASATRSPSIPSPVDRRDRDDRRTRERRPREQAADRLDHLGGPLGPGHIGLGHDRETVHGSRARRAARDARSSGRAGRRRRPRRAARRRSRRPRPACCRPAGRGPGRRRSRAPRRSGAPGGRTRRRWSSRAAAPPAAGPRRSRSGPAGARSCRGRCARPSR